MSARQPRLGFTLIELIVLIVVLATAVVGVLLVLQNTVRASADPQVQKQALAIAEAMLDEILLASYDVVPGGGAPRANFDDVRDYDGYTTAPGGMVDINGNAVPGLERYNVSVVARVVDPPGIDSIASPCAPGCPVTEAIRVAVTVTHTDVPGFAISLDGYRMRYAAP